MYLLLDSQVYLGKSKEFNNEGMKVQVKRAFKFFFLPEKKADRLRIKFSLTSNTSLQRWLYPLFQNHRFHFLLLLVFQRIFQPSGQDQQNGKQTHCGLLH